MCDEARVPDHAAVGEADRGRRAGDRVQLLVAGLARPPRQRAAARHDRLADRRAQVEVHCPGPISRAVRMGHRRGQRAGSRRTGHPPTRPRSARRRAPSSTRSPRAAGPRSSSASPAPRSRAGSTGARPRWRSTCSPRVLAHARRRGRGRDRVPLAADDGLDRRAARRDAGAGPRDGARAVRGDRTWRCPTSTAARPAATAARSTSGRRTLSFLDPARAPAATRRPCPRAWSPAGSPAPSRSARVAARRCRGSP